METWKKFVLIAVLIAGALLVYIPHYNYGYPLHVDEWNLISEMRIVQNEGFQYLVTHPVESGFVFSLYILDLFFSIILFYKFLPLLNFVMVSLVLFYFLNKNYGYWQGVFAIVFFASLKSNVNILGNWFFVPIVFAILFIYSYLFNLEESLEKKKSLYLSALFLFLIAFIHPSSFLVLAIVGFVYYGINHKKVRKSYLNLWPFLFLLIPVLLVILYFGDFSELVSRLVWLPFVNAKVQFTPLIYGILAGLFGILGFYLTLKRKELLGFRIYVSISLISIVGFWLLEKSFFSSYQRYLYHFMSGAVVFSAIGLYEFLKFVFVNLNKYRNELRVSVLVLIVLITGIVLFQNYGENYPGTEIYHLIDDSDYDALLFLKDYDLKYVPHRFYLDSAEVISSRDVAVVSYAISNKASAGFVSPYSLEEAFIAMQFFDKDCDFKEGFLDKYENINYVYSYEKIECSFLREIYRNDKVFLYERIKN